MPKLGRKHPWESEMPCHMQIDYSDPDWLFTQFPGVDYCAGNLIFYRNWLKSPRSPELYAATQAVNPSQHVFLTPEEFFGHHAPGHDPGMVQRALWPYAPDQDDVYDEEAG